MPIESPTTSERYWLCPLYFFECDCESVDLTEGIQIKSAPSALREYIAERTRHLYGLWHNPSEVNFSVILPHTEETGANMFAQFDEVKNLLCDLITSFRLYKEGRVCSGPLISATFNNSQYSLGGTTLWTKVSELRFFGEESPYVLSQTEISGVNALLQNTRSWRLNNALNVLDLTLERFHSAYHGQIEDRIIDQMIAFESLFLRESQEVTYKLALRTAFLLGKIKSKRIEIFKNMKKAYNYRSRIVHGDNPPTREELQVIVPNTGDYLRQSIQKFLFLLSSGISLNEIRSKLDENILSNGKLIA